MYTFLAAGETWHDLMMEHRVPFRLYTYYHLRKKGNKAAMIGDIIRCRAQNPEFRFFLDSGAYSMLVDYRKRPHKAVSPHDYAEEYIEFVERYGNVFDIVAELDIDGHMEDVTFEHASDWYKRLWAAVGPRLLYCWHPHRGKEDWEFILSSPEVRWVALANDTWKLYGLGKSMQLINQARRAGKYIHGFGQTRIQTDLKYTKWTSIDSSSWVQTERYGGIAVFHQNTLKVLSGSGSDRESKLKKRALYKKHFISQGLDYDKIMAEDPPEVRKAVLFAWRNLAWYFYKRGQRLGTHLIWNQPPWNAGVLSQDDIYRRTVEAMTKKMSKEELDDELELAREKDNKPKKVGFTPPKAPAKPKPATFSEDDEDLPSTTKKVTSRPVRVKIKLGGKKAPSGTDNVRMPVDRNPTPQNTLSETGPFDDDEAILDQLEAEERAQLGMDNNEAQAGVPNFLKPPEAKPRQDYGRIGVLAKMFAPPTLEELQQQMQNEAAAHDPQLGEATKLLHNTTPEQMHNHALLAASNSNPTDGSVIEGQLVHDDHNNEAATNTPDRGDNNYNAGTNTGTNTQEARDQSGQDHPGQDNNPNLDQYVHRADSNHNDNQPTTDNKTPPCRPVGSPKGESHDSAMSANGNVSKNEEMSPVKGDSDPQNEGYSLRTESSDPQNAAMSLRSGESDRKVTLPVLKGAAIHAAMGELPQLACDSCAINGECPKFEAGSLCAFEPLFKGLSTRDAENVIPVMEALADVNLQRTMQAVLQERLVTGGMLDPRVTAQLNNAMAMLQQVHAVKAATNRPDARLVVERRGNTMSVQAEGPADRGPGLLSKLFGGGNNNDNSTVEVNPEVEEQ